MKKLYTKNELLFSIVWIIVYVVFTSIADGLSGTLGMEKSVTAVLHIAMTAVLFLWIRKNGLLGKYGLCRTGFKPEKYLFYIPLVIVASCNLWYGVKLNMTVPETVLYIISMLCVGFLEEIIFRGLLFKAMCVDNVKAAIIVSSVTFGIGHIINLFNGSGMGLVSNLCQVVSAVAFGFLFVIIFHKGGSLIPCILTHSAINGLSAIAAEQETAAQEILTSAILTVIAVAYTWILMKTLKSQETENEKKEVAM